MSQQGKLSEPPSDLETLTGNSGGIISPDAAGNINVIGSAPIVVTGNPATNTLTIDTDGSLVITYIEDTGSATPSGDTLNVLGDATQGSVTSGSGSTITITNSSATTTQKGVIETATDAEAVAVSSTTAALVPSNMGALFNSPPAIGGILANTGTFTQLDIDNIEINGNVISSTDTNGPITLTPDGTGVVQISYATQHAIALYGVSGALSEIGPLSNGQLVIGSTGVAPVAASLTSTGSTITITPGAGSINLESGSAVAISFPTDSGTATPSSGALTIAGGIGCSTSGSSSTVTVNVDGGGIDWSVETGTTRSMTVNTGNIGNNAAGVTFTLPDTAAVGSIIRVTGLQASWTIAQNAGETIYFGSDATTTGSGGSLASTNPRDAVELVCVVANTDWQVISSVGNINVV